MMQSALLLGPNKKQYVIGEIISSPLARWVETALRFADAMKDLTETSEIRVRDRLREQRAGQLSAGDLVSLLDDTTSAAALICTHGDLAGALPMSATLKRGYSTDGWFDIRPVLALVEYERQGEWDNTNMLCCESPANGWESLLVKQQDA